MIIGLVGKPSAGKSTFFKAATLAEVEIANYPFTTINKNEGIGYIKIDCIDSFFKVQCNPRFGYCINHKRFVPVRMIDVAGLVPDAHKGKGRGNQFLDDLRQADALIHVVDVSGSLNENGEPVAVGSYDPAKDIEFLEYELDMWFFQILSKGWDKFSRQAQQEKANIVKAIAKQLSGLGTKENIVESSIKKLNLSNEISFWDNNQLKELAKELRRSTKPTIIAANKIDVKGADEKFKELRKQFPDLLIIPCSAESELALREASKNNLIEYIPGESDFKIIGSLNDKQKKGLEFIKEDILNKYKSTGVQDVLNKSVFDLLKYIAIFPGGMNKLEDSNGNILPDCFLMPPNSTALDFAYSLHTDLGDNFIKAMDVKKRLPVGKDHKLNHLDVIEIMHKK
ncbi:MAG: redox-regulated ATPase YchF [Candidatus Nanoarchaeia archaeon]|nr:redox-regulated ATPase YchF [Candidatus Nanoarchaeia archaeon]